MPSALVRASAQGESSKLCGLEDSATSLAARYSHLTAVCFGDVD